MLWSRFYGARGRSAIFCHRLAMVLSLWVLSHPAAANAFEQDVASMREIYLNATDGDKKTIRQAIIRIREFDAKYPNNPLVTAYLGGALSLRGMDISARPLDRMRETEEGLNLIDRALRRLPQATIDALEPTETRLVAAYVFINLPDGVFHRFREGDRLVKELLARPRLEELPAGMRAAIFFAGATAANHYDDRVAYENFLKKTVETDPDSRNGKKARELLKKVAK